MPRNARCVKAGLPYHVTQRGTNRQRVFFSAADRRTYLDLVMSNLEDAGIRVFSITVPGLIPPPFRRAAFSHSAAEWRDGRVSTERARGFRHQVSRGVDHEVPIQGAEGGVAERTRDLIRQICEAREVVIVRGSVSPDHVHMLLSASADLAPAKLVQYIKGGSSRKLQDEFPELRKRYWGQHLWVRGYFCATVGAVDEATICEYIENQKWDQDDQGFKITAPTEP